MALKIYTLAFWLLSIFINTAVAEGVRIDHVHAELIADHNKVISGQTFRAGIKFKMDPEWHIYWTNPGDSGIPTSLEWLTQGLEKTKVNYPAPHRFELPPMANYGYGKETLIFSNIEVPKDAKGEMFLQAKTTFLMCKDICLPGSVDLNLPVTIAQNKEASNHIATFDNYQALVPLTSSEVTSYYYGHDEAFIFKLPKSAFGAGVHFVPSFEGVVNDSHEQSQHDYEDHYRLVVYKDKYLEQIPTTLQGIITDEKGFAAEVDVTVEPIASLSGEESPVPSKIQEAESLEPTITPTRAAQEVEDMTLLTALIFAFLGGLVLNLMPCVLPVLSLKIMSLIHHTRSGWSWLHGIFYTAGVLTTFYLFALALTWLKAQGTDLGWGFQLQSPMFVASLAVILFLIALELFNVYEIGTTFGRLQNLIAKKTSVVTTFLSGMLITVVATPCTVPFMGGAVAYSLGQSEDITIQVFLMLGFGLAFPYLLLTFIPKLRKALPKPGAWEERFQEFLGFPMLATALWLTWVYAKQTSLDELYSLITGLFALGLGAWFYGHMGSLTSTLKRKLLAFIIFYASLAFCLTTFGAHKVIAKDLLNKDWFETKVVELEHNWKPWSAEAVNEAKEMGRPVFIDFTADWCITCKANEHAVLERSSIIEFMDMNGVLMLKADWTKQDEIIGAELARYGRKGVPLYVAVNAKGEEKVLPQLLTFNIVTEHYK